MSADLIITNSTQRIVVDPATSSVTLVLAGPPGPPGPAGPSGTAYKHDQLVAAIQWTVNHNLGYQPNVQVQDAAGNVATPGIVHLNNNSLRLDFLVSKAGTARCS